MFLLQILIFLFGLVLGSFLNVVIYRGPIIWKLADAPQYGVGLNLAWPRSHCPHCSAQIKLQHLIPVIGYILLRGQCVACNQSISPRYPLIELLAGAACLSIYNLSGFTLEAGLAFACICFLITLAAIDHDTTFLPDALTIPFLLLGLITNINGAFASFSSSLIGLAAGFLIFWGIGEVYFRLRGIDGLGQGDAKFLAGIGAWFGWTALPFVVMIASLSGLIALGIGHLRGTKLTAEAAIPFGPFLALGAAAILIAKLLGFDLI